MRPTSAVLPRLPKHLLIRTQNEGELRKTYAEIYAEPHLTVNSKQDFDAAVSQCELSNLRIGYGRYGTGTSWEFPDAECFLFLVPIEGTGLVRTRKQECEVGSGKSAMISPAAGYTADYDASLSALSIKFAEPLLRKKLEAIAGVPLDAPVVFDVQSSLGSEAGQMLRNYILYTVHAIEQAEPALPQWWIHETEQLFMMMLLCGQRHNYSDFFGRSPAEVSMSQIKTVESYIEANYDRPITVEELAEIGGVSVFALHRSFKTVRGYSPMQFAERIRREKTLFQ